MLGKKEILKFINEYRNNTMGPCNFYFKSPEGKYIDADCRTAYIAGVEVEEIADKQDVDLQWSVYSGLYRKNDIIALGQDEAIVKVEESINIHRQHAPLLSLKKSVIDDHGQPAGVFGAALYIEEMSFSELSQILDFMHRRLPINASTSAMSLLRPTPVPVELTRREQECAHYLCQGMSAREIALQLGLSKRTVESYLANMKNKLDADSRSELIRCLLRGGFLPAL